jgi:hypothetical protein
VKRLHFEDVEFKTTLDGLRHIIYAFPYLESLAWLDARSSNEQPEGTLVCATHPSKPRLKFPRALYFGANAKEASADQDAFETLMRYYHDMANIRYLALVSNGRPNKQSAYRRNCKFLRGCGATLKSLSFSAWLYHGAQEYGTLPAQTGELSLPAFLGIYKD